MTIKKYLLMSAILISSILSLTGLVFADAKTLPAGVWMLNVESQNPNLDKIASNFNSTTDSWAGGYSFKKVTDISLCDLGLMNSALQSALSITDLSPYKLSALTSASSSGYTINLAYGITDQFTFSFKAPYNTSTVKSNAVAQAAINAIYGPSLLNMMGNLTSDELKGSGYGNPTLAFKYALAKDTAIAVSYETTAIKLGGKGPNEISSANPNELSVKNEQDKLAIAIFYDVPVGIGTLQLLGAYQINQKGKNISLLNLVRYDQDLGDELSAVANLNCPMGEQFSLDGTFVYSSRGKEKSNKEAGGIGDLTEVANSDTNFTMVGIGITYKPVIFFEAYGRYDLPLSHKASDGPFSFPGYVNTSGIITFGATLYYQ